MFDYKIAKIATEKQRFDFLDILDQILEELYNTNENTNKLSYSRIINPHLVRSKRKSYNKRFKSSVEMYKDSNKNGSSIQNNNE
ncbi:10654_t:CDS:2 [Funneliformis caledonium]|uniref:10654_t:CDS:1 n=1 Tax=Funneliformis caledonium TaxID=1117310 RepID=A0A9N8V1A8_9GLOM|nr:10654_t:CDS:2 [Funneliformis caledonium]